MPALIAAGAFTVGILFRELNAPFWITLPAAGIVGAVLGVVFGLPSLRLRGLYLAVSTLALYFVVIYVGGEYETPPRLFHRHRHRPAAAWQHFHQRWTSLVFHSAHSKRAHPARFPQSAAPRAPAVPGAPYARTRRWPRRSASGWRPTSSLPSFPELGHYRHGRRIVRLLSRVRLSRGVLALSQHPICRHGDRRRHGFAFGCPARGRLHHDLSLCDRGRADGAARCAAFRQPVVCGELCRVRSGHGSLSPVRAARARRNLAPPPELLLLWPYKHRAAAGARR